MLVSTTLKLVGYFKHERIRSWLRANHFPAVGGTPEHEGAWRGIVFTVSRVDVPKWVMERCRPEYVAFVASRASEQKADELARHATNLGMGTLPPVVIADPDDPAEVQRAAAYLLDGLHRAVGDGPLAVDVTGGKVPMSIGAFMAAEEHKADTLYASTDYDTHGKPIQSTLRLVTLSRPS